MSRNFQKSTCPAPRSTAAQRTDEHPSGGGCHAARSAPLAAGSCGAVETGIKYNRNIGWNSGISAQPILSRRLCLILSSSLFYPHSCRDKREIPLKGKGICNIGGRRARRYSDRGNTILPEKRMLARQNCPSGLPTGGVTFLRTQSNLSTDAE